jgi:hypothetical protein
MRMARMAMTTNSSMSVKPGAKGEAGEALSITLEKPER